MEHMEIILTIIVSLGVAILGYMAIEVRGLRTDLTDFLQRLARIEGRLEIVKE